MAQFRQFVSKIWRLTSLSSKPAFAASSASFSRKLRDGSKQSNLFPLKAILAVGVGMGMGVGFAASAPSLAEAREGPEQRSGAGEHKAAGIMGGPVITRSGKELGKLKIFVGYDPREELAYEVCRHSILKHASFPVEVIPIKQSDLRNAGLYWRSRGGTESTEFSFTRFLTPFLAGFQGWALFVDCDFLYTADIKELAELIDDKYAIMCVQHDYKPKTATKMDGVVQTTYPRKNWSSMVLYNCEHPKNRVLTPSVVNSQSGAFLHRFMWLDDSDIGSIPFTWNFLVGHNEVDPKDPTTYPKAIHYTLGGPWFEAWKDCPFADLWLQEMEEYKRSQMIQKVIQDELMKLLDTRMDDRAGGLETRVADLEGKVKEISALQKLLLIYLQEKFLTDAGNGSKEPPVDA
ncbi:hypothetical protein SUGI_1153300 [Cryptomeria japonica]|uniref:protein CDI n=1 Tax=Cryptomeria japonica TaxID=3369 RepID=UPI0024147E5B|nr:protein CDI [Cryptomeria japonica]GLJ53955.1 hypothetical protein SUGI_1153300 [Cryptomeria japonica]